MQTVVQMSVQFIKPLFHCECLRRQDCSPQPLSTAWERHCQSSAHRFHQGAVPLLLTAGREGKSFPPGSVSKGQPPSQIRATRAQRFYQEGCVLLSGRRRGEGKQLTQSLLGWEMDTTFPLVFEISGTIGQKQIVSLGHPILVLHPDNRGFS